MGLVTCKKCGRMLDMVDAVVTGTFDTCRNCKPHKN